MTGLMMRLILVLAASPLALLSVHPRIQAVEPTVKGKPWIGREAAYETYLRTAPIERLTNIPIGVTRPRRAFFKPGGLIESAAIRSIKPGHYQGIWESYRSEIAAYELDKLLALQMVPVTVERRVEGELVSAQMWVGDSVGVKELTGQRPPDIPHWNRQLYRQRLWDNLVANVDRNEGNLLVVRDPLWVLVLIDHTRCFTGIDQTIFPLTRIDRSLFEKLKALDKAALNAKVSPWVTGGAEPILKRRDSIVAHFTRLAAEQGEANVFIP